jgi:hypothetical protein
MTQAAFYFSDFATPLFVGLCMGDLHADLSPASRGNAFDPACDFRAPPPPPAPVDYSGVSETKAARHKRVRREAKRKAGRAA